MPLVSVRVLEPGSYAGVNKEDEAAGDWNLMRKTQPVPHIDRVPGKVTCSDVVANYKRGHGHRRQAAMSEFLGTCHTNFCKSNHRPHTNTTIKFILNHYLHCCLPGRNSYSIYRVA